jgi:hypothetical protein
VLLGEVEGRGEVFWCLGESQLHGLDQMRWCGGCMLLVSLTRDVANAELCLGHFDGCPSEHERLVRSRECRSRMQMVVVGESAFLHVRGMRAGTIGRPRLRQHLVRLRCRNDLA